MLKKELEKQKINRNHPKCNTRYKEIKNMKTQYINVEDGTSMLKTHLIDGLEEENKDNGGREI